jgi:uncharacterized membrane protein
MALLSGIRHRLRFIGIMWINHQRLFTHIRKSDNGLLILNLG